MNNIFTIGFTKKTAQVFFESLRKNKVNAILDIRLNNTSQLAGFSKFPDIKYFLKELCSIDYISNVSLTDKYYWNGKYYKVVAQILY